MDGNMRKANATFGHVHQKKAPIILIECPRDVTLLTEREGGAK